MPLLADDEYLAAAIHQLAEWARAARAGSHPRRRSARIHLRRGARVRARRRVRRRAQAREAAARDRGGDVRPRVRDGQPAGASRRNRSWSSRDRPRRRACDRRNGPGEGGARRRTGRDGRRRAVRHRADVPGRSRAPRGLRRSFPRSSTSAQHILVRRGARHPTALLQREHVRPADEHLLVRVSARTEGERPAVGLPLSRAPAGCGASGRLSRALRVPMWKRAPRSRLARRPRLGAARNLDPCDVQKPADLPGRLAGSRARRCRRVADPSGGVALELLLLPRGARSTDDAFCIRRDRPGRDLLRRRRSVPGLRRSLRQPRLPRARRPSVLERRRSASWSTCFERDALRALEEFRAELHSVRFDERRLDLEL